VMMLMKMSMKRTTRWVSNYFSSLVTEENTGSFWRRRHY
jgi:hypothetical protein